MVNRLMLKVVICISLILSAMPVSAELMIIAHRGGKLNWPENTLYAFKAAQRAGVDAIELDVQVTKDNIPVVYHGRDLSKWTDGSGKISKRKIGYIQNLNAAWQYKPDDNYPYRSHNLKIPTLLDVLSQIKDMPLIIDMKSLPAEPLVKALVNTIPEAEWQRLVFYSTDQKHLSLLKQAKPQALVFEDRSRTRARLLKIVNSKYCDFPASNRWLGFELKRTMEVKEKFSLGESANKIDFDLWRPESIDCTRKMAKDARIVLFGINTAKDFAKAKQLQIDAVYTDNPLLLLQSAKGE